MTETHTDFEKWLASFPEKKLLATLREYTELAEEYDGRAEETRSLIALRRRLLASPESKNGAVASEETDSLFKVAPARRPSLADAVVQVVDAEDQPMNAKAILKALEVLGWAPRGKTPVNSIHATASRLVKDGRLVRTPDGYRPTPREAGG